MRRGLALGRCGSVGGARGRARGPVLVRALRSAHIGAAMLTWGVVTLGLAVAAIVPSQPAAAQADLIERSFGRLDSKQPLLLQADNLTYDRKTDRVIAEGSVEVYYNNYSLLADELIYDQRNGTLEAVGNVRIKEPDGSVIKADRINLTDDFREGFVRSLDIVTKDQDRIAARRGYRKDGETTVFERGAYTPCKVCTDKDGGGPLWQINARKIIHDTSEGNIYYEDATLEFLGLPIVYIPYFYHPDPSVKRRSGFLTPKVSQSDDLGFVYEQPYYYVIAPNKDLIVAPIVTTEAGFLLKTDWRHRLDSGEYRVMLAGVHNDDPADNAPTDSAFRGTIETQGNFRIGSFWNWGWDITAETDDTFRRFYKFDDLTETERTSEIFLIGQSDRNYFSARAYSFVNLTPGKGVVTDSDTLVHPVIDYNYIADTPVLGGELSWDTNVVSLSRSDNGPEAQRLTTELSWRRTLTDGIGQRLTPFAAARADFYNFTGFKETTTEGVVIDRSADSFVRQSFTGGADYRFPFVKHTSWASHVIEPVAQIIVRSDIDDGSEPPNEDAQSLVFDDTLLFDVDKFSGYDRLETGTRANYGVQYTLQSTDGSTLRTVVGQSYHIAGSNPFGKGSGLEDDASDYIIGAYLDVPSMFRLVTQARLDQDSFDIRRLDISASAKYGPLSGSVNYVRADEQPGLGVFEEREEILAAGALQVTDLWSVYGSVRYNLEIDEAIKHSVGIKYNCDCFMMAVTYTRSTITDRDIEPDESILVSFEFKNLGGTDLKTDMTDGFAVSASAR